MLKIHRASVEDGVSGAPGEVMSADADGLVVATGSGGVRLLEVQAAGGKRLKAGEFLRGNPLAPGARFS